ncbi:MAG TPA: DUF2062 domain-containing protein [Candidatus Deferrimicrobium sp.]
MGTPLPKTLLVIPVHNHAATLRAVALKGLAEGFPVLVVDDGSTDGGLDAVVDLPVARHRFPWKRGKGAAILAAAELAKRSEYDAIVTIDADGRHDPADARRLLEAVSASWPAVAIGARRMEDANAPPSGVFPRDFSNFLVRLECGRALHDSRSGYRLYPVDFLLAGRFLSAGIPFEVEVLVRAGWAGLPLLSVPVPGSSPSAGERISHFHLFLDNLRLFCLHAWLVARSLLPWPHRRRSPREDVGPKTTEFLHPVRFFRRLSREHSGAGELAAAVWVGIFLGALPILPFGTAAIVYVNHRLHLNKLAGVAASNICCVPFVPLACVEAGYFFRHGRFLFAFDRHVLLDEIPLRLWEWLLGALVIGPILGFAGALLTYFAVRSLRANRSPDARPTGNRERMRQ